MLQVCAPACQWCKEFEETYHPMNATHPSPQSPSPWLSIKEMARVTTELDENEQVFVSTEWGVPQYVGTLNTTHVLQRIKETNDYMKEFTQIDRYKKVGSICANRKEECSYWASHGTLLSTRNHWKGFEHSTS